MKALAVAILATVALLSIGTAANARVVAFEDTGTVAYTTPVIDSVPVQADDYLATWAMGPLLAQ
jgi:hypothetical protein